MLDDEKPEPFANKDEEIVYINMPMELITFARFWQRVTIDRILCSQHGNFAGSCFEMHHPEVQIGEVKYGKENVGQPTHS